MFGSKKRRGPTVVGAGCEIEGTLRADDGLQVDGTIDGDVEVRGGMSVGPEGTIRGDVRADSAAVAGRIEGNLSVEGLLRLLATGRLDGEVEYGTLSVEEGGRLSGKSSHIDAAVEEADEPLALEAGDELSPAAAEG